MRTYFFWFLVTTGISIILGAGLGPNRLDLLIPWTLFVGAANVVALNKGWITLTR